MPDTALADGDVYDAAYHAANVQKQVVAQLATASLPAAATEGRLFADTTVNALKIDTGAALVEFGHWSTWTSYTPTWGGVTLGNGTKSGSYFRHGSLCFFAAQLSFGSTTAVTAEVSVSTPFTMADAGRFSLSVLLYDAGTAWLPGASAPSSTTAITVRAILASGTYASTATMSSTVPFTWTTGDGIYVTGWFPVA